MSGLQSIAITARPVRTGHRKCTDEEYNQQKRCWTCGDYSFKGYASEDENNGKCFVAVYKDENNHARGILYSTGLEICDGYKPNGYR